ncbi:MAG TPA: hypothetical protein VF209_03915 [Patescibacteria group bacterium]
MQYLEKIPSTFKRLLFKNSKEQVIEEKTLVKDEIETEVSRIVSLIYDKSSALRILDIAHRTSLYCRQAGRPDLIADEVAVQARKKAELFGATSDEITRMLSQTSIDRLKRGY